jgi:hypothetical protein
MFVLQSTFFYLEPSIVAPLHKAAVAISVQKSPQ